MTLTPAVAHAHLAAWSLTLGDPAFVHQHVVDAWTAQTATVRSAPIGVAFALIGLCLHLEHGRTGREVQQAHMRLARVRRDWPVFALPTERGAIGPADVLAEAADPDRVAAVRGWCEAVWGAYAASQASVRALLEQYPADVRVAGTR